MYAAFFTISSNGSTLKLVSLVDTASTSSPSSEPRSSQTCASLCLTTIVAGWKFWVPLAIKTTHPNRYVWNNFASVHFKPKCVCDMISNQSANQRKCWPVFTAEEYNRQLKTVFDCDVKVATTATYILCMLSGMDCAECTDMYVNGSAMLNMEQHWLLKLMDLWNGPE